MLQVKALTKTFGQVTAVQDVSFSCEAGEILGLLGENGAGKTTTLRMLATILTPSSGTALINGSDLVREPQGVRSKIGVLSADPGLYDRLSAREILVYYGHLYDLPRPLLEQRVEDLLDMLEMRGYADRRTGKLSKGMKQKVAIARALIHDPPVLLLDEPTSGLDVSSARLVVDFIRRMREMGKCVVFSSHIMSEVERLCDRVAIIHQGRIAAGGTLSELGRQGRLEDIFLRLRGAQQ